MAQRAAHVKRRKQIWEALNPETGGKSFSTSLSDGRKAGPQHEHGFAASTAEIAGVSKQSINQHIARADALGDDILEVVGTVTVAQTAQTLYAYTAIGIIIAIAFVYCNRNPDNENS